MASFKVNSSIMPKRKSEINSGPSAKSKFDPSRRDSSPSQRVHQVKRKIEEEGEPGPSTLKRSKTKLNYEPEKVVRRPIKSRVVSQKEFICQDCGFGFTHSYSLTRHRLRKHTPATCIECKEYYQSLDEHVCQKAPPTRYVCTLCDYYSDRRLNLRRHFALTHSEAARATITRRKEYLARRRKEQLNAKEKKEDERRRRSLLKEAEIVHKRYEREMVKKKQRRPRGYHKCWICEEKLEDKQELEEHLDIEHHPVTSRLEPGQKAENMFGERMTAFKGTIAEYRREYEEGEIVDLHHLFRDDNAANIIAYNLAKHKSIKFGCSLTIKMQVSDGDAVNLENFEFRLAYKPMYLVEDLYALAEDTLSDCREELKVRLDQFEEGKGSGWRIAYVVSSSFRINKLPHLYEGKHGVSYVRKFIDEYIEDTFFRPSNIENVPAKEEECFYYAVAQYFVGRKYLNANQMGAKKKGKTTQVELDEFIKKNIKKNIGTPARFDRTCRFEEVNSHLDFKINIFLHESSSKSSKNKNRIVPLRPSKCKTPKTHTINLLLLHVESLAHYVLIRDLSKCISRKYLNDAGRASYSHHEPCPRCFTVLSNKRALEKHLGKCGENNTQRIELEPPGKQIEFTSEMKKYRIPIYAVADFEAKMVIPGPGDVKDTQKRVAIEKQVPVSYSFAVFNHTGDIIFRKTESSQDECMRLFFRTLREAQVVIEEELKKNVPHGLSSEEMIRMKKNAKKCVLCKKKFNSYKRDRFLITKMTRDGVLEGDERTDFDQARVIDHCHISGDVIGVTHNRCNRLRCSRARDIPTFLHNFSGYDAHFIATGLSELSHGGENLRGMRLKGLSYNQNKLRTLNLWIYKFIDSMAFLDSSLDSLVNDLVLGKHEFPIIRKSGIAKTPKQLDLICRKGIFPYSALTCLKSFEDAKEIPPKEFFYSNLNHMHITDDEYEHAKEVFREFECKNMKEYLHLYNEADVFLLSEAILCFRDEIYKHFELDLFQYISVPQLSLDAFLKYTETKIDNIRNVDLFLDVEKNIRGGVSFVGERWAKSTEDEKLLYVDANNLYGLALSLPLPVSDYEQLDEESIRKIDWRKLSFEDDYGYIASVTLEAPPSIHERLEHFPPGPHKQTITYSMLSPYAKRALAACTDNPESYSATKLICSFLPKKEYLSHGMCIKLYLELGYKIKAIHSVTRFRQKRIFKKYIEKTMELRQKARSKFQSNLWKRMNNALFGKTIQNNRKYIQTTFFVNQAAALKYGSSPRFEGFDVLDDNLVLGFSQLTRLKLNKPYLIGFSILELSKCFMFSSYHNIIRDICPEARLLMTDTDSMLIALKGETPESAIKRIQSIMDFSNLSPDNELFDLSRKSVIGYFKEELGLKHEIEECSLIRSKCYSLKLRERNTNTHSSVNKCKGVKKRKVEGLPYECYKSVLVNLGSQNTMQTVLRSYNHNMYTLNMTKRMFTSFEDKTYLKSCGIHSYVYGHRFIKERGPGCDICGVYEDDDDSSAITTV